MHLGGLASHGHRVVCWWHGQLLVGAVVLPEAALPGRPGQLGDDPGHHPVEDLVTLWM